MKALVLGTLLAAGVANPSDCNSVETPVSSSGVKKADVQIPVGANGLTTEQTNIRDRLKQDNEPGALKFLYIISPMTGDVLMFSTVKGKVTSGGKRLTPLSVTGHYTNSNNTWCGSGFSVQIGNDWYCTSEVLQDDGTYGSSGDYLYWWDTKGVYHQLGVASSIWHVTNQPMSVRHTVLNLDTGEQEGPAELPTPKPAKK